MNRFPFVTAFIDHKKTVETHTDNFIMHQGEPRKLPVSTKLSPGVLIAWGCSEADQGSCKKEFPYIQKIATHINLNTHTQRKISPSPVCHFLKNFYKSLPGTPNIYKQTITPRRKFLVWLEAFTNSNISPVWWRLYPYFERIILLHQCWLVSLQCQKGRGKEEVLAYSYKEFGMRLILFFENKYVNYVFKKSFFPDGSTTKLLV